MQAILISLANVGIIFGVLIYSGSRTEKAIHDAYMVRLEQLGLDVSNPEESHKFYTELLGFKPVPSDLGNPNGFFVPGQNDLAIFFSEKPGTAAPNVLSFEVRSNFEWLHKELLSRIASSSAHASRVSEISAQKDTQSFTIRDLDNNVLIFQEAK